MKGPIDLTKQQTRDKGLEDCSLCECDQIVLPSSKQSFICLFKIKKNTGIYRLLK
jgi:hypothetical protein